MNFDLEQRLPQWRQELEATLAFSSQEIDELEDHLRSSFDAKIKEGIAPENAWSGSLSGLGPASALALEFAKDKLMPAIWRLFVSWWRPALLLVLFGLIYAYSFTIQTLLSSPLQPPDQIDAARTPFFWVIIGLGFLATLILLPRRTHKNALLAGIGNAFCLIPLLHLIFYNAIAENVIGPGWSHMAASFGWFPISLGVIGLVVINTWWWKIGAHDESKRPGMLAVVGMLVLVLALSPFVGEMIGNLSIRDVYAMPTPGDVTYRGEIQSDFLKWKFVDVLVGSMIYIVNILPFSLTLVMCLGVLLVQSCARGNKSEDRDEIFPSITALPWMMTLLATSLCWVAGCYVEPPLSTQMREANAGASHSNLNLTYGGLEITVLFSAILFFACEWELTKKLARASRLRPFYAWTLVIFEVALALGSFPIPSGDPQSPKSNEPEWLSWTLAFAILPMAFSQGFLIVRKLRVRRGETSLWRFEGGNLVEMGLLLGVIFAGTWLILGMVAIVMAFESTSIIRAMIAWGTWFKDPLHNHFYPQMYGTPDHLAFWVACGITYLSFCLAAGLGIVIVLSGLEFIRFNSFRLYKVRKIRQGLAQNLVLND